MKIVAKSRPPNRNTITYRKAVRNVARRLVYRYDEDKKLAIHEIARKYYVRSDEAFVREAVVCAIDLAERNVQSYREDLDNAERYLAEVMGYVLSSGDRRPTLRVIQP